MTNRLSAASASMPMNKPMAQLPPDAAPPPDLFDLSPVAAEEAAPPKRSASLPWARIAAVYLPALGTALLFRFPHWAVLALPLGAVATQTVRRLRWPYRIAVSAAIAAYGAQITSIVNTPAGWGFRFASAFALLLAGAFFWGQQTDGI